MYFAKVKKNDPNHESKLAYSYVLADCTDFLNEKTCLMFLGERLEFFDACQLKKMMEKEAYQNRWYESSRGEHVTISWHIFILRIIKENALKVS
jgi:hypothetical protein